MNDDYRLYLLAEAKMIKLRISKGMMKLRHGANIAHMNDLLDDVISDLVSLGKIEVLDQIGDDKLIKYLDESCRDLNSVIYKDYDMEGYDISYSCFISSRRNNKLEELGIVD